VLSDAGGKVAERVRHDAYGSALHHHGPDLDGDRDADGSDAAAINALRGSWSGAGPLTIAASVYRAEYDLDRDGVIGASDALLAQSTAAAAALPAGWISASGAAGGPDSIVGFGGYLFNRETMYYTVRHRHDSPALGRFLQRDPAGYIDGSNLFLYTGGNPVGRLDPFGLEWTGERWQAPPGMAITTGTGGGCDDPCKKAEELGIKGKSLDGAIEDACESNDPVVQEILALSTPAFIATGEVAFGILADAAGRGMENAARVTSTEYLMEADKWRRQGMYLKEGNAIVDSRIETAKGVGGKAAMKIVGHAFDGWSIYKGVRNGDANEIIAGVSGIIITATPGVGPLLGMAASIAGGVIEGIADARVQREMARKNPGRCAFLKGQREPLQRRIEEQNRKCNGR